MFIERHAEGNYRTKHAETARFYYTTIHIHLHRYTKTHATQRYATKVKKED